LIVLNPPRKGVQSEAMAHLSEIGAPRIIYVSCEPKSLARDLARLDQHGYRVTQNQPFDMFPQTEEVETVVKLER
jgi:23S rRNA (uracil1939-C5)-methyltransferase